MNDSKLVEVLKTFSKEELRHFQKFTASPYFNNGRNYLPLLKELQKFHPEFKDPKLTYEYIYNKIYPRKAYNRQVMWNQVSGLEKLTKEFLFQNSIKEHKMERYGILFKEMGNRNLNRQCLKEMDNMEKYISSINISKEYFYYKYLLENHKTDYWNSMKGETHKGYENVIKGIEYMILNMLIDLSIEAWDMHVMKVMYNTVYEDTVAMEFINNLNIKEIINTAERRKYKYAPVMRFYYNKIMCAFNENEEKYFFEMKEFFENNHELFSGQERKNIIITLANYCAHKMRLGNDYYLKILFDINKLRLNEGLVLSDNGRIPKALYHQVLRNALSVNEIKWAEKFVKDYTGKLAPAHQKTMEALAYGYIYHSKKDYGRSLTYLGKVEFIDIRDKLHVRLLSAKNYYELADIEGLLYYIDSSKHFISKSGDIEQVTKDAYLRFFTYLNNLAVFKESPDEFGLKKIKEKVSADKALRLRHKEWFYEKIGELSMGFS